MAETLGPSYVSQTSSPGASAFKALFDNCR
jgi:hypothetical protein